MTAVVADAIFDGNNIRQVTNSSHRVSQVTRQAMGSGGATVLQVSGITADEVTTISSADLAALLALNTNTFISSGLAVASGTVTVPYKERAQAAFFASGSNHNALSGTDCLIVPTSIEASQDDEQGVSCTCDIHWISSDGETKGATLSTGNALAAQAFNAEFSLGVIDFNGTDVEGVQSVRVNPGITIVKSREKGGQYPVLVSIQEVMPSIEITVDDFAEATPSGGWTAMTSANVYFRKRADSGLYVSDVTAEHIKITFAAGLKTVETMEASDNSNGSTTITLKGKTLTASAASAIT
jgi:hypothetical protein